MTDTESSSSGASLQMVEPTNMNQTQDAPRVVEAPLITKDKRRKKINVPPVVEQVNQIQQQEPEVIVGTAMVDETPKKRRGRPKKIATPQPIESNENKGVTPVTVSEIPKAEYAKPVNMMTPIQECSNEEKKRRLERSSTIDTVDSVIYTKSEESDKKGRFAFLEDLPEGINVEIKIIM